MPRIAPAAVAACAVAALDLVGDRPVAHREDLEAAGVGDHRLVPAHEAVDAAEALDQLRPRREEQVERVREHHVVAEVAGLGDLERLDDRLRGERDERRRADLAVVEARACRCGRASRGRACGWRTRAPRAPRNGPSRRRPVCGGARAGPAPRSARAGAARRRRSGAGSARARRRGASGARGRAAPRRASVSTAKQPRPSDVHVSRTIRPSRSSRSTRRVTPERLSSTLSASSAIRSRLPGADCR